MEGIIVILVRTSPIQLISICINVPTRSTLVLLTKDSFVSLRTNLNNKKQCLLAVMSRTEKKNCSLKKIISTYY